MTDSRGDGEAYRSLRPSVQARAIYVINHTWLFQRFIRLIHQPWMQALSEPAYTAGLHNIGVARTA